VSRWRSSADRDFHESLRSEDALEEGEAALRSRQDV
jgi:hypothetical protein